MSIDRWLQETGVLQIMRRNVVQECSKRRPETEYRVLQRFHVSSSTNIRSVAAEFLIRYEMMTEVLSAENMHPYHIHKVLDATQRDSQFPAAILFSGEAENLCFTREGVINMHNAHMW